MPKRFRFATGDSAKRTHQDHCEWKGRCILPLYIISVPLSSVVGRQVRRFRCVLVAISNPNKENISADVAVPSGFNSF